MKHLIVNGILFLLIFSILGCTQDSPLIPPPPPPYIPTHLDSFPKSNADLFIGTYKGYYRHYNVSSTPITYDSTYGELIVYRKAFDKDTNCIYSGRGVSNENRYTETSFGNYLGGRYREQFTLNFKNSNQVINENKIFGPGSYMLGLSTFIGTK